MIGFDRKYISAADQERDGALLAMKTAVRKAKKNNSFVVHEATANDLVFAIFDIAKNDEGVHLEKAFGIVGSLAGFSCAIVAALRHDSSTDQEFGKRTYSPVRTQNGETLYFGDFINEPLIEDKASFYRQIASRAATLGANKPFDLKDIFAHHAGLVGAPKYGKPRMPKGHILEQLPLDLVIEHWPDLLPILNRYDDAYAGWPISWGATGAQLMEMSKEVMPAQNALTIMMECALPMSKIGPSHLEQAAPIRAA